MQYLQLWLLVAEFSTSHLNNSILRRELRVFLAEHISDVARNCGVPLRINRSKVLTWNSRHITSFAGETDKHLLRSAFLTKNFRWI